MNSHETFIHIHQGCFAGTGAIVRLPQCQWSKPDGYGKISQCITTTKHSKAKTVCIFLGIYCIGLVETLLCIFPTGFLRPSITDVYSGFPWPDYNKLFIVKNDWWNIALCHGVSTINSCWPSGFIWGHRTWSAYLQVMASCLMAPSQYNFEITITFSSGHWVDNWFIDFVFKLTTVDWQCLILSSILSCLY